VQQQGLAWVAFEKSMVRASPDQLALGKVEVELVDVTGKAPGAPPVPFSSARRALRHLWRTGVRPARIAAHRTRSIGPTARGRRPLLCSARTVVSGLEA